MDEERPFLKIVEESPCFPGMSYLLWYFWKKQVDQKKRKRLIPGMSYLHPSRQGLKLF
jgi:hypothetical protein